MSFLVIIVAIIMLLTVASLSNIAGMMVGLVILAAIFINFGPALLVGIGPYLLIPVVAFALVSGLRKK